MLVFKDLKKLFVLACGRENDDATLNSHRKYFFPRMKIKNYNIEIDIRNFYDQSINDLIKQYEEVRKISTGQGDDWKIKRNNIRIFQRNNKSVVTTYKWLNTVK